MVRGAALSMLVLTICSNSWSVKPGKEFRTVTLATPTDVVIAKSGGSERVVGEPVHAVNPTIATSASIAGDGGDRFGAAIRMHVALGALVTAVCVRTVARLATWSGRISIRASGIGRPEARDLAADAITRAGCQ